MYGAVMFQYEVRDSRCEVRVARGASMGARCELQSARCEVRGAKVRSVAETSADYSHAERCERP